MTLYFVVGLQINKIINYTLKANWDIPEKNKQIEDMKFSGQGIKEIACGISKGDQEKIMWNFQEI